MYKLMYTIILAQFNDTELIFFTYLYHVENFKNIYTSFINTILKIKMNIFIRGIMSFVVVLKLSNQMRTQCVKSFLALR